jgi:Protein of unknown function (DUF2442)
MKSAKRGKNISEVEVQGISKFGVWLYAKGNEYFLCYDEYPWFKNARVSEVMNVRLINANHLEWPELDVDLELESLETPQKYPLKFTK